ncbi:DMT family transporter [Vibrio maerlii]|uniref:DMT family transporter n=1 Tax=Vibrio maerlii TaxID=2231648 RepID=UPI000E3D865B|nr:DMT family transporter [Vibrio maerlii]
MNASRKGEILLLTATLFAAIGWVTSKYVLIEMPSNLFIAGRFFIASSLLLPFCFKELLKIPMIVLGNLIAIGLLLAASIHVWVYAVSITNSLAEGAFIMSLAMIIAPLTRWIILRKRPNIAFWLSLPMAVAGMMFLTLTKGWNVDESLGYFFLSSSLLSIHFVLNKKTSAEVSPLPSICIQMLVVGATGGILYVIEGMPHIQVSNATWVYFAIATLLATALRYLTQTVGQHKTNIETASLIMILEPIWTLIMSMTLFGEPLTLFKTLGSGLIILSLYSYITISSKQNY